MYQLDSQQHSAVLLEQLTMIRIQMIRQLGRWEREREISSNRAWLQYIDHLEACEQALLLAYRHEIASLPIDAPERREREDLLAHHVEGSIVWLEQLGDQLVTLRDADLHWVSHQSYHIFRYSCDRVRMIYYTVILQQAQIAIETIEHQRRWCGWVDPAVEQFWWETLSQAYHQYKHAQQTMRKWVRKFSYQRQTHIVEQNHSRCNHHHSRSMLLKWSISLQQYLSDTLRQRIYKPGFILAEYTRAYRYMRNLRQKMNPHGLMKTILGAYIVLFAFIICLAIVLG
ncbi:MAG: hypothetical protein Fur005_39860 [Roseiflexaceae bacterium]